MMFRLIDMPDRDERLTKTHDRGERTGENAAILRRSGHRAGSPESRRSAD
jgi:hypothetical protein